MYTITVNIYLIIKVTRSKLFIHLAVRSQNVLLSKICTVDCPLSFRTQNHNRLKQLIEKRKNATFFLIVRKQNVPPKVINLILYVITTKC